MKLWDIINVKKIEKAEKENRYNKFKKKKISIRRAAKIFRMIVAIKGKKFKIKGARKNAIFIHDLRNFNFWEKYIHFT